MFFPKLYTDEDVDPLLASILREKGFDTVSCHESRRYGKTDEAQLQFATQNSRVLLTHNIRDFCLLAKQWATHNRSHAGIILAPQVPFSMLLHATIRVLGSHVDQSLDNQVIWLRLGKS